MDLTFGQNLNTEQIQQLSLTPEMVQSLKLLRLGGEDLLDYIFEALEENPVLDIREEDLADRQLVAAVETDEKEEPFDDYGDSHDGSMDDLEYGMDWDGYYSYYDEEITYGGEDRYTDYSQKRHRYPKTSSDNLFLPNCDIFISFEMPLAF